MSHLEMYGVDNDDDEEEEAEDTRIRHCKASCSSTLRARSMSPTEAFTRWHPMLRFRGGGCCVPTLGAAFRVVVAVPGILCAVPNRTVAHSGYGKS